ncbi:ornithine cyclodeaminase family protein [Oceanobacillus neutriphilus]|uniref:Ornithine cyclodeaminase n=1 Tax=Oceanobacillus neutriphilus TaxID=531815 RepID=A0ABQ2P2N6_9BACI|nr:ornithine cyclodeaminase family protein [Oceanobacillus neutriphilus]GGP16418.1 ornithine cyclodeaminase [Oceanobacillus neutriphilus]
MTLFLSEKNVKLLLPMKKAIEAVKYGLNELVFHQAQNQHRSRVAIENTTLNTMSASIPEANIMGVKNYTFTTMSKNPVAYFLLFSGEGDLLCLMEADELGRIRTGAVTGLATDYLAVPNSKIAALLGTGFQAETQLKAICEVRELDRVNIWSHHPKSVYEFCRRLQPQINTELKPTEYVELAVKDADIITTATSAAQPILQGDLIHKGVHLNAIGNNRIYEREIASEVVNKADIIITDSIEQSKMESGDLVIADKEGVIVWDRVHELTDLIVGKSNLRTSVEQITLFKSNGLAIEDLAAAYFVYKEALRLNIGIDMAI